MAFENFPVVSFRGERMSKCTVNQMQLNVVQDSKGGLRELLVTGYTYGFALIGFTFEGLILEPLDDLGKVELERVLAFCQP